MNFKKLFDNVNNEFGLNVAIQTVVTMTTLLNTKIKKGDLSTPGQFKSRVEKKAADILWEDSSHIKTALDIIDAWDEFTCREAMHGLGKCVSKSLKEIIR